MTFFWFDVQGTNPNTHITSLACTSQPSTNACMCSVTIHATSAPTVLCMLMRELNNHSCGSLNNSPEVDVVTCTVRLCLSYFISCYLFHSLFQTLLCKQYHLRCNTVLCRIVLLRMHFIGV